MHPADSISSSDALTSSPGSSSDLLWQFLASSLDTSATQTAASGTDLAATDLNAAQGSQNTTSII